MSAPCPCCGHETERPRPFFVDRDGCALHVDGVSIHLSPEHTKFAAALERKYPQIATKEAILELMYGNDPNGGPEYAETIMSIYVHRIRKKLQGTTLSIENVWGSGYKFVVKEPSHGKR